MIAALPAEPIAEVQEFVASIAASEHERERELARTAKAVSATAFAAVWNNSDDDVYDAPQSGLS